MSISLHLKNTDFLCVNFFDCLFFCDVCCKKNISSFVRQTFVDLILFLFFQIFLNFMVATLTNLRRWRFVCIFFFVNCLDWVSVVKLSYNPVTCNVCRLWLIVSQLIHFLALSTIITFVLLLFNYNLYCQFIVSSFCIISLNFFWGRQNEGVISVPQVANFTNPYYYSLTSVSKNFFT